VILQCPAHDNPTAVSVQDRNLDCFEVCIPNTKKKTTRASTRSRRSPRKREVVVEERTRVVPSRRVVAVSREPVTLSRALGEAAVVEPMAEPPLTSTTVISRKRA
jgi:hypothetical protein